MINKGQQELEGQSRHIDLQKKPKVQKLMSVYP